MEGLIEAYDISYLRSQVGYVPQDVFLFSDTIANNIAFADQTMSREEIEQYARDADLYENISNFPKGFDTRVGERGNNVIRGVKSSESQSRGAIAREPKILILDDALSAVDTKTENTQS